MQHTPVHDAPRERQHQFGVWNGPEVVGEVRVYDFRVASEQRLFHFDPIGHRTMAPQLPTTGMDLELQLKILRAEDPGSFFESREWKSFAAYRRPKGEVWDERKEAQALLPRMAAAAFEAKYETFLLAKKLGVAPRELGPIDIAGLEAEARAYMHKHDRRKKAI